MAGKPLLSPERKMEIAEAFSRFYDAVPREEKRELMEAEFGCSITESHSLRTGRRLLPPRALAVLWQRTGDTVFLYSRKQRLAAGRRGKARMPTHENWPALEDWEASQNPPPTKQEIDVHSYPHKAAILTVGRRAALAVAWRAWYDAQPAKAEACRRVGANPTAATLYSSGKTNIPARVLALLWQETHSIVFLYTIVEKRRYVKYSKSSAMIPPEESWPTLELYEQQQLLLAKGIVSSEERTMPTVQHPDELPEEEERPTSGIQVLLALDANMKRVEEDLVLLNALPADDPVRVKARKHLAPRAMAIYRLATELSLEFPQAFTDLLEDLEFVTHAFGGN